MSSALLSALHLLGLGVGLGAVFARGRAFQARDLEAALYADNWWGLAAMLWLSTGLFRAFGGLEKGTTFYLANPMFHAKLGLLLLLALLELYPMVTLLRWRIQQARGEQPELAPMGRFLVINRVETAGIVAMVFLAALMARGVGM